MQVIETFIASKTGDPSTCEDLIVECDGFLAVFDGATDKTEASYDGMAGGRFAVRSLERTLDHVAGDIKAAACVKAMTEDLRRAIAEHGPSEAPDDNPSASVLIFSAARSEVWRVGDCSWMRGSEYFRGGKEIDGIVAAARAALLHALLDGGASVEELRDRDPGRAMLMPLLEQQFRFRNSSNGSAQLGFGALDGKPVPERFVEVVKVKPGDEIVFATDGYPELQPTLEQSEEALAQDLASDPLRIGRYKSTKAVKPGAASFDDRAFARFRV
ncbi:MAG TPA: hypothetical protein VID51_04350 [Solirubrobacterales bacterium]|jgi:hypothetical protein